MSLEMTSLILTAIQTGIIVISLLFLFYQIKQFDHNLRQDSYGKQIEFSLSVNELLLHNKLVADQLYQNNEIYKTLDDAQKEFYNYLILIFCLYERLYLLFQAKRIEKKAWEAWERWFLQVILPLDLFLPIWNHERTSFHEDFYKYIDAKCNERKIAPLHHLTNDEKEQKDLFASEESKI